MFHRNTHTFCNKKVVRLKRFSIAVCFALLLFSAVSCHTSPQLEKTYSLAPPKSSPASQALTASGMETAFPSAVHSEKPVEKLLTKSCDIHKVVEKHFLNETGDLGTLSDIAADIGVECLRETEAGALYSVHKVQQGGRLYIFYANFPEHNRVGDIIRWFYVQKNLAYADFSGIQNGDTMEDVKRIDPTAQIFENMYRANPAYWDATGFGSLHYLTDGVLEIGYRSHNGKLTVIGQKYIDDFQLPQYSQSKSYPYEGRILSGDRLP